jgi:alpha-tubulin suppressor-like RCC1 family protein
VSCWGSNDHGQLGARADEICEVPDLLHNVQPPLRTPCRGAPAAVDGLNDAVEIAIGGSTSCARTRSGSVRCWGQNSSGMVGDGTTTDRAAPVEVKGLSGVVAISLSWSHACARLDTGEVACWGENFFGQLGSPPKDPGADVVSREGYAAVKELVPVKVPGLDQVVEVAAGDRLSCARRKNGEVLCFGQFAPGILGNSTPTVVPGLAGVTALALGQARHCAVDAAGAARCWGQNGGLLLDGSQTAQKAPVAATGLPPIADLSWSANRACIAARAGEVLCWGNNGKNAREPPKPVALTTRAKNVALGANHACALGVDGSVWCWGDGFYGETGARKVGGLPTSAFWTPPRRVLP